MSPPEPTLVFLKPGQMMVSSVPLLVTTLLGSCVAVTLFSARHHLGAICHAQLPSCSKNMPCDHARIDAGKYVECAIERMLARFSVQGVAREEIRAKLFGGADMFDKMHGRDGSVGKQNMEMALRMLEKRSVRVVRQDLGGERGRKIVFHTHTGEVFLKRLGRSGI